MMARAPRRFGLGTSVPSRICRACHTLQVNLNPPPGPRPPPALPSDSAAAALPLLGDPVRRNAFARDRDPSPPPCYVGGRRAVAGDSAAAAAAAAVGACGPGLPTRSPAGPGRADSAADSARESDGQSVSSGASSPGSSHSRPGVASACDDVCGLMVARWARRGRAGARAGRGRSVSEHGLAVPPGRLGPGTRRCSRGPGPDSRADGGDSALSTTDSGTADGGRTTVRVRLSTGSGHHDAQAAQAAGGRTAAGQPASGRPGPGPGLRLRVRVTAREPGLAALPVTRSPPGGEPQPGRLPGQVGRSRAPSPPH